MPAKAKARRPAKPSVAAQLAKAASKKKPRKPLTSGPARRKLEVGPQQRRRYVEVAACFIAERHGFTPGREHKDWVAAEADIDRMISEGLLRVDCAEQIDHLCAAGVIRAKQLQPLGYIGNMD